ncbi:MAG: hypothetical protein LBK83_02385 [Treponema sp.]|nr:hypothetical protein [Treponema sp.]
MKKMFVLLFFLPVLFCACTTAPDPDNPPVSVAEKSAIPGLLGPDTVNPQVLRHTGYEAVYTGDVSAAYTVWQKETFSDYTEDGDIAFAYHIKGAEKPYYRRIGRITAGTIALDDFPSPGDIFVNETSIKIADGLTHTFSEEDLLIKGGILELYEQNDVVIEPDDAHVIGIDTGRSYGRSRFAFFDVLNDREAAGPPGWIELYHNADFSEVEPNRVFDGILILLFDKDALVKGVTAKPVAVHSDIVTTSGVRHEYEIEAKKGWNIIWVHGEYRREQVMEYTTYKTDLSGMPRNVRWVLRDNAPQILQ